MATPESPDRQPDKPFDAGDAESVGRKKADANARALRKREALRRLLSDPAGREWVWDLLADCYIFGTTYTGNAETYFREGKRNVGLQVLDEMHKAAPDSFANMMKENMK